MHNGIFYAVADYKGDDMTGTEQHILMMMARCHPATYTLSLDDPSKHVCIDMQRLATKTRKGVSTLTRILRSVERKGFIKTCGYRGHVKCYAFLPDKLGFSIEPLKIKGQAPRSPSLSEFGEDELSDLPELSGDDAPAPPAGAGEQSQGEQLPASAAPVPVILPADEWTPEAMVMLAGHIAGKGEYSPGEYQGELQAARAIFAMRLEHADYQPIDRATFEAAYRYEQEQGKLAGYTGRALCLQDFGRSQTIVDKAIRLSREAQAKRQRKPEERQGGYTPGTGRYRNLTEERLRGEAPPLYYPPPRQPSPGASNNAGFTRLGDMLPVPALAGVDRQRQGAGADQQGKRNGNMRQDARGAPPALADTDDTVIRFTPRARRREEQKGS
jgi:hypothetical protein